MSDYSSSKSSIAEVRSYLELIFSLTRCKTLGRAGLNEDQPKSLTIFDPVENGPKTNDDAIPTGIDSAYVNFAIR
jgi:hypothetical protein